ncbi:hypothetical protein QYS62_007185 [Fusarium acuminatum]|uniref:Uncharacterized protein n=1 Tax=Fusarium acuminatum TaxID=5515 RepID=A0ABZ2X080_9HYPO
MPGYDGHDDDDYYSSSCCIGCCRAGDFGTHDACGPCYCRRSFKPDYDPSIYTGWSFGHYYPGDAEDAGSSAVTDKESKSLENTNAKEAVSQMSEQKTAKHGKNKSTDKPKIDESSKSSKTPSKTTEK